MSTFAERLATKDVRALEVWIRAGISAGVMAGDLPKCGHEALTELLARLSAVVADRDSLTNQRDQALTMLSELLEWASSADEQIHGEWGIGAYVEAEFLTKVRAALAASGGVAG